jgi:hypothetical protein
MKILPRPLVPSVVRPAARCVIVVLCAAVLACASAWHHDSTGGKHRGCTVVTVARGGRVIFAGNDDYIDRDSVYWVDPPGPGRYGAIWIGARDNVQQGFNEKGLAYDANGLPAAPTNPHLERLPVRGGYTSYPVQILRSCATVEEVITWVREHRWHDRMWDQLHFADSTGDAVVISAGQDGELVFTRKTRGDGFLVSSNFNLANPANGEFPCWRYDLAKRLLAAIDSPDAVDIPNVARIMDAVHLASPTIWTKVTVVADLVSRTVNVYYFHQFDRPITLRIDDELARRPPDVRLSALFPADTIARADRAYERLVAVGRRVRIAALAWLALVVASAFLVWGGSAGVAGSRRAWMVAAAALGPVAIGAWLATGRGKLPASGGRWRHAVASAARAMPPFIAGTVFALAAVLLLPAIGRAGAGQLAAIYGLPLVLGGLYRPVARAREGATPAASSPRLLQTLVAGHLTIAGLWVAVMMAFGQLVRTAGVGVWAIVLAWPLAVAGSLLGGTLVAVYFVTTPSPSWRRSWWWVPVSLGVLGAGAVAGGALSRWLG